MIWVDSLLGTAGGLGTEGSPRSSIALGQAIAGSGEEIVVVGEVDGVRREYPEAVVITQPQIFRGYGSKPPILRGSVPVSGFALDAGSVYGVSLAADPLVVTFYPVGGGAPVHGLNRTLKADLSANYEWNWTGGTLWVYLNTGNPDAVLASVRRGDLSLGFFADTVDNVEIYDFAIFEFAAGVTFWNGRFCNLYNSHLRHIAGDSWDGDNAADFLVDGCDFDGCGIQFSTPLVVRADGDHLSAHGNSNGVVSRSRFRNARKAALNSIGNSSVLYERNDVADCTFNLLGFTNPGFVQRFARNKVRAGAADYGALGVGGPTEAYGNTFVGSLAPGVAGFSCVSPAAALRATGNISTNFAVGAAVVLGALTEDHNCLGGNTAAASGFAPDASDVLASPQLVDRPNGDYRLAPASPCRGASIDLSAVDNGRDFDDRIRVAFDIGAINYRRTRGGVLSATLSTRH